MSAISTPWLCSLRRKQTERYERDATFHSVQRWCLEIESAQCSHAGEQRLLSSRCLRGDEAEMSLETVSYRERRLWLIPFALAMRSTVGENEEEMALQGRVVPFADGCQIG